MEESTLISAAIGGAVTLLAVWIAHRLTLRRAKAEPARDAAANLRAAFAPQLAILRTEQSLGTGRSAAEIQALLSRVIDAQTIEMQKFRSYVSSEDLPAYNEACSKYEDIARLPHLNYTKSPFPEKVAESHIGAILKFAKSA